MLRDFLMPVARGVGFDGWDGEHVPGGTPGSSADQWTPWSVEPDRPLDLSGLELVGTGPALAELLSGADPVEVAVCDLVDVIAACERLGSWVTSMQVAAMAELSRRPAFAPEGPRDEWDDLRSAGLDVAARLSLAPSTGERRVGLARQLVEELPGTFIALANGAIDYRRASAIADAVVGLRHEQVTAVEEMVLPRAGDRTVSQHRAAVERAVIAADPADAHRRHQRAARRRRVDFLLEGDGMGEVRAELSAEGLAMVRAALDSAAVGMTSANPSDERTVDQRRADALVELARLSLASGWLSGVVDQLGELGGIKLAAAQRHRPSIQVTVPMSTLFGLDEEPAELAGYGPICACVARRLAAEGTWRRLVTDPVTGALLDYGRTTYRPPQELVDFVTARDQTCRAPGCQQPAHRCQIDHTTPFPVGPTSEGNTGPFCLRHHNLKTHGKWRIEQPAPGVFVWNSPSGHAYPRGPEQVGQITVGQPDDP